MNNKTIGPTSFTFKGINWGKVVAGAGCVIAGPLLTYLTTFLSGWDFGAYTTLVMTIWGVIAIVVRKWVSDQE